MLTIQQIKKHAIVFSTAFNMQVSFKVAAIAINNVTGLSVNADDLKQVIRLLDTDYAFSKNFLIWSA